MKTKFEKVSREQFAKDWQKVFGVQPDDSVYDELKIPNETMDEEDEPTKERNGGIGSTNADV